MEQKDNIRDREHQLNLMLPINGSHRPVVPAKMAFDDSRSRLMSDLTAVGLRKPHK
jgi:hypothetical protein